MNWARCVMKQIDLQPLRRFFLGVMHWPPQQLMTARLEELQDARDGFADYNGLTLQRLPSAFLKDMMQKFPDKDVPDDNPP